MKGYLVLENPMKRVFNFNLNITLADGGASAEDVISLYKGRVMDDIDQIAWNLCNCDDKIQSEKFDSLVLNNWYVNHKTDDVFLVVAHFTVNALNEEFINLVIDKFMDNFANCITMSLNGYYSRTGERVGFNPNPLDWEIDIK
jgi:hypothetical protein